MVNINDLLREHVTLDVQCLDRIYLNGYVPALQVPGQLVTFLVHHRKQPVPSPVLLGKMTDSFRQAVERFAAENQVPIVHFKPGERKDDIAAAYRQRFDRPSGVVFIGVAQEKASLQSAQEGGFATWLRQL